MKHREILTASGFALILMAAFLLRLTGLNWDNHSYLQPDERFLTTIASKIGNDGYLTEASRERCSASGQPNQFFNTACSSYNPNNINEGSFAYGTLPLYIVRGVAQIAADINFLNLEDPAVWHSYDYVHLVGRATNALFDTFSVLLIFVIGSRLFTSVHGLIASAFYAFAVLPIQLAHFWAVDTQASFFFLLGLWAAVELSRTEKFRWYVLFGFAFGAALASRVNMLPMVALLPIVLALRWQQFYFRKADSRDLRRWLVTVAILSLSALIIGFFAFRIFQPYAFSGPGFTDIELNPKWVEDIRYVSGLSSTPTETWPPSIQWFQRTKYLYPLTNIVLWGLGLLVGIAALASLAAAIWVQIRKRRLSGEYGMLVLWILGYFAFLGGVHQMTMRYYLPLYGPLVLIAAWGLMKLPLSWRRPAIATTLLTSVIWALAFISIYFQPITRIQASQWIVNEIPGAIALGNENGDIASLVIGQEHFDQHLNTAVNNENYTSESFQVTDGQVFEGFAFEFIEPSAADVAVQLLTDTNQNETQSTLYHFNLFLDESGQYRLDIIRDPYFTGIEPGQYRWRIEFKWTDTPELKHYKFTTYWNTDNQPTLSHQFENSFPVTRYIHLDKQELEAVVTSIDESSFSTILIPHMQGETEALEIILDDQIIQANLASTSPSESILGDRRIFALEEPVIVEANESLSLKIRSASPVTLTGSALATEGAWDDSLPSRHCMYKPADSPLRDALNLRSECIPFDPYGQGFYVELPLNMAERDTRAKWLRVADILMKADYLLISSNRFYDAQIRLPSRFPDAASYYDALFDEVLGYEIETVFSHFPQLLGVTISDQSLPIWNAPDWQNELEAEEAFTVYDHPTVFILQNAGFGLENIRYLLAADTEEVVTETTVESIPEINLDELEDPTFAVNQPDPGTQEVALSAAAWIVGFFIVGWLSFPLMYWLFPSLPLRGFWIGRSFAWLILSVVAWWLTSVLSARAFWTSAGLWALLGLYILLNLIIAWHTRHILREFISKRWKQLLFAELFFVIAIAFGLLLRVVDPDLWHVNLGGEKPMDFAFFNAVLRTPTFPPPNPWLSGYPINYYYFGFVIAAVPTKLGGFTPAIATNLVLATIYALVTVNSAAFLYALLRGLRVVSRMSITLLGTAFVMLAGNLGTLLMLIRASENVSPHRWYWYPTRVMAEAGKASDAVINEFPIFSFLFGDLHAHIIALLPITLFALILLSIIRQKTLWLGIWLGLLAAVIFMTNTWDVLFYVPLGAIGMWLAARSPWRFIGLSLYVGIGGILTILPYFLTNRLGSNGGFLLWTGERSIIEPFFIVWGIPIVITLLYLAYRLKRIFFAYTSQPVEVGMVAAASLIVFLLPSSLSVAGLCLVFTVAGILLIVKDEHQPRLIPALIIAIYSILFALEFIVIRGDVGRMNTVFKASFQLWLWSGILLVLIISAFVEGKRWALLMMSLIVISTGFLFPVKAIPARFEDNETGILTLDGNNFMDEMVFTLNDQTITVANDRDLINYMHREITGFPTIAEWYMREYAWNSRISVQTGFPAVVGWQNHLKQQYTFLHPEIERRIANIQQLYTTEQVDEVRRIIALYEIDFIVVGELEQSVARSATLSLFENMMEDGELERVYDQNGTYLYRVVPVTNPQ